MFPIAYVIKKKTLPVVSDPDAQAFVNAALIYNTTQANAINTLVIGLKADSLWTPIQAFYPFVGGNAYAHKFNLKNPVNSDAAFRLSFSSGWTHNANGAQPSTAYADTFLIPSTTLSLNSASMFLYWTTTDTSSNAYTGGKFTGGNDYLILRSGALGGSFDAWCNNAAGGDFTNNNPTTGFLGVSRTSSTNKIRFVNATNESVTQSSSNAVNVSLYIGSVNGLASYQNGTYGAFVIASGLNTTQGGNLYSRIQTYQTTLGRNT